MYIVGNEITITWVLAPTDTPLLATDFDISFFPSNLEGTYTDDAISNYSAPSAEFAGSLTYAFTPNNIGHYRVNLTCGVAAAFLILDEKHFWVFGESLPITTTLEIFGLSPTAGIAPLKSESVAYDNQWKVIDGICQDPVNPALIWFCGEHDTVDTKASIANIDTSTGTITEYIDVVTLTSGKILTSIAVNQSGRVVVSNRTQEAGSNYESYYSDAPYTTWTKCTRSGFITTSASAQILKYDSYLDVFWWITGSKLGVSSDGITFTEQTFDQDGDNATERSAVSFTAVQRLSHVGANILYGYSQGAFDDERIFATDITPPIGSLPRPWQDIDGQLNIFGGGFDTQQVIAVAPDLSKASAWMLGDEKVMSEADGGLGFDPNNVTDISSQIAYPVVRFFTIHDFGKSFIGARNGNSWVWYESTDMVTWTLSTDTRITAYDMTATTKNDDSKIVYYEDGSGIAFINEISAFNFEIVAIV